MYPVFRGSTCCAMIRQVPPTCITLTQLVKSIVPQCYLQERTQLVKSVIPQCYLQERTQLVKTTSPVLRGLFFESFSYTKVHPGYSARRIDSCIPYLISNRKNPDVLSNS